MRFIYLLLALVVGGRERRLPAQRAEVKKRKNARLTDTTRANPALFDTPQKFFTGFAIMAAFSLKRRAA
jgi:hypothetical protein